VPGQTVQKISSRKKPRWIISLVGDPKVIDDGSQRSAADGDDQEDDDDLQRIPC